MVVATRRGLWRGCGESSGLLGAVHSWRRTADQRGMGKRTDTRAGPMAGGKRSPVRVPMPGTFHVVGTLSPQAYTQERCATGRETRLSARRLACSKYETSTSCSSRPPPTHCRRPGLRKPRVAQQQGATCGEQKIFHICGLGAGTPAELHEVYNCSYRFVDPTQPPGDVDGWRHRDRDGKVRVQGCGRRGQ
eukprot:scaffold3360_cov112-Isochrysis_galbana.AAC.7